LETIAFDEIIGHDPLESRVESWNEGKEDREEWKKIGTDMNKKLLKSMHLD